jgi:hypothetical protein
LGQAGEIQQVGQDAPHVVRCRVDLGGGAFHLFRTERREERPGVLVRSGDQLGEAQDGRERRAQLVGDGGDELVLEAVQRAQRLDLAGGGEEAGVVQRDGHLVRQRPEELRVPGVVRVERIALHREYAEH